MALSVDDTFTQKENPSTHSLILKTIARQYELQQCELSDRPNMANDYNTMYVKSEHGMPLYRRLREFLKSAPND